MATLVYTDVDGVDRSFSLGNEPITVGRAPDCNIRSEDPRVSRFHARFFVDQGALVGPEDRIRKRFRAWEDSGASGLTIGGDERAIRFMAECARLNFAAE